MFVAVVSDAIYCELFLIFSVRNIVGWAFVFLPWVFGKSVILFNCA